MSNRQGRSVFGHLSKYTINLLILCLFIYVFICLGPAHAGEKRHHGAHVHGVANLNIAIEGHHLHIEFTSPAANIVGFEHHPHTEKQKSAVDDALKKLQKGESLFLLSPEAKGRMAESSVTSDITQEEAHAEDESTHTHAKHDHHADDGHKHEKGKHAPNGHKDEHHSDFSAAYIFDCREPGSLSRIEVKLFDVFPGIDHINVQVISPTGQTAMKLTAKNNLIKI
jgi:hypothetical protein